MRERSDWNYDENGKGLKGKAKTEAEFHRRQKENGRDWRQVSCNLMVLCIKYLHVDH